MDGVCDGVGLAVFGAVGVCGGRKDEAANLELGPGGGKGNVALSYNMMECRSREGDRESPRGLREGNGKRTVGPGRSLG